MSNDGIDSIENPSPAMVALFEEFETCGGCHWRPSWRPRDEYVRRFHGCMNGSCCDTGELVCAQMEGCEATFDTGRGLRH